MLMFSKPMFLIVAPFVDANKPFVPVRLVILWPLPSNDPVKYDFAIFGKGIEETYKNK